VRDRASTIISRLLTSLRKSTPSRRRKASAGATRPSLTKSIANRSAACGVRFAARVCRIHNLPFSIVNSTSWMSAKSCSSRRSASRNCRPISGSERMMASSVSGLCPPDTTSSPWDSNSTSITGRAAPVEGSRENATPAPDDAPALPKTIACTVTAVPCKSSRCSSLR